MSFTKANRTVLDLNEATVNLPTEPYQLANKKYVDDKFAESLDAPVAADIKNATITSTLNQTSVPLPMEYYVGTNSLFVFVDGVYQIVGETYTEVGTVGQTSTSITFISPLPAGAKITVVAINPGDRVSGALYLDDLSDVDTTLTVSTMPSSGKMLVLDGAMWKTIDSANFGKTYQAGSYLDLNSSGTFSVKTSGTGSLDDLYLRKTAANFAPLSHNHDTLYWQKTEHWNTAQWINGHDWYWKGWSNPANGGFPTDAMYSLPAKPPSTGVNQYVRQKFPGGFFIETGIIDGSVTGGKYIPDNQAGNEVCVVMSFVCNEVVTSGKTPAPIQVAMEPHNSTLFSEGQINPVWKWQPADRTVSYIAFGVIKQVYATPSSTTMPYPSAPKTHKDQKYAASGTISFSNQAIVCRT